MEGAGSVRFHRTTYDRSAVKPGIVHLGYGAFHRAHQAVFLDDYMENSGDLNWGIVAVNLRAPDAAGFAKAQSARDGYMLKSIDTTGRCCWQLVRSHVGFVDWSRSPGEAEGLLSTGSIHGVTLTVTESGYYLGDNGSVNLDDPVLRDEVSNGSSCTVYGFLARALERRAKTVDAPVSILCCDNIRGNGRMLRSNFLAYLDHTDREWLRDWVEGNVAFPCSMVDRITPRATDELRLETQALFPGTTLNPIHSEAFIQWVLEDRFAGPMPDLEKAGVQVVADVFAYEEAKIRILNGGHAGLAYLGALAGFTTFDEAINDPVLRAHFDGWERKEVLPGLTIDLPFDKHAYLDEVTDRFRNTAIADQLERICMDGWSKMPIYIRPTLASCLKQGILPIHGFDCVAGWYVYARRHSAGKMPVHYIEPYWNLLEPYLVHGEEANFARAPELWGDLPRTYTEFTPGIVSAINRMEKKWLA